MKYALIHKACGRPAMYLRRVSKPGDVAKAPIAKAGEEIICGNCGAPVKSWNLQARYIVEIE